MIFDRLENLNQYTGLFEHLDTAIDYIESHDLSLLPPGRTNIDGENVYVNVFELEPRQSEEIPFETHSRYMDLQVDLEGAELCEVALGELTEKQPYDEETDAALYGADTSAALVLGTDRFAVFMVEEPHKPGIRAQGFDHVKKAVFKIAY